MRTLFTVILSMMSSSIFAQSYIPIPESDAVWIQAKFRYSEYNNHEHATVTEPLSFGPDSILGGVSYHTFHGHAIADWVDNWGNQQTYQDGTDLLPDEIRVLFRQDIPNKLIYQWDNSTNQEQILYDFDNLVVGQPYPPNLEQLELPTNTGYGV